jgi:hypothetical protein
MDGGGGPAIAVFVRGVWSELDLFGLESFSRSIESGGEESMELSSELAAALGADDASVGGGAGVGSRADDEG